MDFARLPVLEGALLDLVTGAIRRPAPADTRTLKERLLARQSLDGGSGGSYGETALQRELDELRRASSGTRNHALNKAAFSLHQLAQEGHLDPGDVDERLRATAAEIGLTGHEVELTLGSARKGAHARPRTPDRLPSQAVEVRQGRTSGLHLASPPPAEAADPEDVPEFLGRLQRKTWNLEQVELLPDPVSLVDECLMKDSLCVLWGPPASKKSFLAIDLGLCIATGSWWHGRRVAQGGVVHFAGEGAHGIKNRVAAWLEEEGIIRRDWPWRLVGQSFNLLDQKQYLWALAHLEQLAPSLVVIDTMARHTPGAVENDSRDWGLAIEVLDMIRDVCPGCCVLVIHHGNAEGMKMRGHTSLLGAADTSIKLTSDDLTTMVEFEKVKDSARPAPLKLYTKVVGRSIVLADRYPGGEEPPVQGIDAVMRELCMVSITGATVDELSRACAMPSIAVKRALNVLAKSGQAEMRGAGSWRPT